jgi:hypothetical protein
MTTWYTRKDKQRTVDAEWYHEAGEALTPYAGKPAWTDQNPRTVQLAYEELELPITVKMVKGR